MTPPHSAHSSLHPPAKAQLIVSADPLRRAIKHDLIFDKKFFGFSQRPSVSVSVSRQTLYKVQLRETARCRALRDLRNLFLFSRTRFFSLWLHDVKADLFRGVGCGAIFVKTDGKKKESGSLLVEQLSDFVD